MSTFQRLSRSRAKSRRNLWFERIMAILASVNLGLVLFDLSYVPWRDFYLRNSPDITRVYDPIKGIEPHRETQVYLETVNQLKEQVAQTGLQSPSAERLLGDLRTRSIEMIDTNPFQVANKTGTLERIKNRIRRHIGRESSKEAFRIFWSRPYLSSAGWSQEIAFYNREIQPLIATNYFRPIGENGEFVDFFFWRIDWIFCLIFGIEFGLRTLYISRRHAGINWLDAMLWRWYDLFLVLPIYWLAPLLGLLRVIPVAIRLNQANLVNLERVRQQINQGFVANFAEDITEVVVIRVINQIQGSIKEGEISRWLLQPAKRPYIDINQTNEAEAIANILTQMVVYRVLPKIQPDVEALLRHNIGSVMQSLPAYQTLQNVPGLKTLPTQLTEKLVTEITQSAYQALTSALEDQVGAQLTAQLVQHFGEAIAQELQSQHTLENLQVLVVDMLEEIKINYVERLSEEDVEAVMEQTRKLRQMAHSGEGHITPSK